MKFARPNKVRHSGPALTSSRACAQRYPREIFIRNLPVIANELARFCPYVWLSDLA